MSDKLDKLKLFSDATFYLKRNCDHGEKYFIRCFLNIPGMTWYVPRLDLEKKINLKKKKK